MHVLIVNDPELKFEVVSYRKTAYDLDKIWQDFWLVLNNSYTRACVHTLHTQTLSRPYYRFIIEKFNHCPPFFFNKKVWTSTTVSYKKTHLPTFLIKKWNHHPPFLTKKCKHHSLFPFLIQKSSNGWKDAFEIFPSRERKMFRVNSIHMISYKIFL